MHIVALTLFLSAQPNATPQVALVLDSGLGNEWYEYDPKTRRHELIIEPDERITKELELLSPADVALVGCREDQVIVVWEFGETAVSVAQLYETHLARKLEPCAPNVDAVERAIDLKWTAEDRRILVLGRFGEVLKYGRSTLEQAMYRAEHEGIIVHAVEFALSKRYSRRRRQRENKVVDRLAKDLNRFLEHPTYPLGRVPRAPRHGMLLNGGSYHLAVIPDKRKAARIRAGSLKARRPDAHREELIARAGIERAYARAGATRDGLDQMASGEKRPSEVPAEEVPEALRQVDLEPLLDAVWDFVDARRAMRSYLDQYGEGLKAGALGRALHDAMKAPRRLPPSRR